MRRAEIDEASGVETTGHVWDGLKELNTPLPRWWVLTFYVTIVWAVGYWIAYPAWPTLAGYTKGLLGYSQRATVAKDVAVAKAAQGVLREKLAQTPLAMVKGDAELLRFALAGGAAAFAGNCAPCHGRAAQGGIGYPNLNDDDWLWGGEIDAIYKTIAFGVRSGHPQARDSQMPRFGLDKLLDEAQIDDVAEFVLSLGGRSGDKDRALRGEKIFIEQCASCHGEDAKGNTELGAPNLADAIWLYGGDKAAIVESIRTGRGGVMPAWQDRLDPATLKALAVYVHSLGGGK